MNLEEWKWTFNNALERSRFAYVSGQSSRISGSASASEIPLLLSFLYFFASSSGVFAYYTRWRCEVKRLGLILLINLLFKTGCKLFCIQFWGEGGGGSNLILLSLLTLVHVGLFLSSIGPGGLGFMLWVTKFPFVKFFTWVWYQV